MWANFFSCIFYTKPLVWILHTRCIHLFRGKDRQDLGVGCATVSCIFLSKGQLGEVCEGYMLHVNRAFFLVLCTNKRNVLMHNPLSPEFSSLKQNMSILMRSRTRRKRIFFFLTVPRGLLVREISAVAARPKRKPETVCCRSG